MQKKLVSFLLSTILVVGMFFPANVVSAAPLDEPGEIEETNSADGVNSTDEADSTDKMDSADEMHSPETEGTPASRIRAFGYEGGNQWGEVESIYSYGNGDEPLLMEAEFPDEYMTPNLPSLRNQNPYGTCWAHTAVALAELSMIKKGLATQTVDLSELHLAYFAFFAPTDPLGGTVGDYNDTKVKTNYGDYEETIDGKVVQGYLQGGNIGFAAKTFSRWCGVVDESTLPYTLAGTMDPDDSLGYSSIAHLENFYVVNTSEIDAMKRLITDFGGVGVSYYESLGDEVDYYSEENNSYYCNEPELATNHAVTIVGWNDSFPKTNFSQGTPEGDGAWLIRNSWTTGDSFERYGYFWMSYYDESLVNEKDGIAYALDFGPADNFDNNYQYDGANGTSTYNASDEAKMANIFTVKANQAGEKLRAISFICKNTNVDYTVSIYKNPDSDDPESGTLATSQSGQTLYEGNYTIRLDEPVDLNYGDTFSVVVELEKEGYKVYTEVEHSFGSGSRADAGQSFVKLGQMDWLDTGIDGNSNTRVKAFTDNETASYITVAEKSISVNGDISLNYYADIPEEIRNAPGAYAMMNDTKWMIGDFTQNYNVFEFPVSPKNMNDIQSLYFCDESGNRFNLVNSAGESIDENIYSSSLVETAQDIIESTSTSDEYKELAKAMLDYGGYTRAYLGYDDEEIPTQSSSSDLAEITASTLSSYTKSTEGSLPAGVVYAGTSLILNNNTTVRHYFSGDVSGCEFTLDGTALSSSEIGEKDGFTYIDVAGIPGYNLGEPHTLEIAGENHTFELRYSALSYAQSALSKSNSDKLKDMSRTLYNYNNAIKTYFNK